MSLLKKHVYRKLLSSIFIALLLANISFLFVNMESVFASPGLTLKWTRNLGQYAKTYIGPLAADFNGDGKLEIVVTGGTSDGGTDGTVTVLDGTTGNIIWQVAPGGIGMHSPCEIADINKDGIKEIVVSGNYPVVLFGNNGSIYWKNTAVSSYNLYSPVYDIEGDGYYEIFVSSGKGPYQGYDYFTVLSYDGKILNQNPTSWHPCWGGMIIGDANFDGRFELYQGDRSINYNPASDPYKYGGWGIRALDAHTLTPLWNDSSIVCSSHTPMLADVDKDGILDVIVANQGTTNGGLAVYRATDGSVLTTGGKYRKGLSLGLPSHSQPTVADIDSDGNLEIITCRNTNIKIWDLYEWKLDATLPMIAWEPPMVGDITGDGKMDIIAVNGTNIVIYAYNPSEKNYYEVYNVPGLYDVNAHALLEDVDGDGLNELIVTSYGWRGGYVYCFDTSAPAPTPRVRQGLQFYSERHCGAAEYVPPPGPLAPQISEPSPSDGATNVPTTLSQLTFKLTDYQHDPISYTVTTNPDIGSGSGINVPNAKYTVPISNLHYSTTYTWTVTATDGTHTNTKTYTFTTSDLPPWYNTNWQYRRTITIDHTKVSGTQTNFPVLIDLTDSSLTTKAQPDGDDFVFTDANHNKLNHEIELYDSTAAHLISWVNVPYLSSTTDTILYMYYGNPTCENQQNTTAVWDSSYKLVLHLDEKTGIHYDSTINGNNGTPFNGIAQGIAGKIDGADTFDGVNDYIEVSHSSTLAGYTEAFTASFWLKLEDVSRRQAILNKYNTGTNQRGWFIEYNPVDRPTRPFGFYASPDGTNYREWYASFVPTAGVWYYITVVWEANTVPKFYVNGVQVSTVGTSTIASIYNNVGVPLHIGRCTYNTARYLKGSLDEITISNPARSASWILTSYNNQKDPTTFYTIGKEEKFEEPEPPVVFNLYPPDSTSGIELNPTLSVKVTDYQGDLMTIIFSTNVSGTWQNIGSYTNVGNGVYNQTTTNMNNYDTTYWWKVQVTDGIYWTNRTYSFTTKLEPATWWNTDWQYRRIITIDPSQVSSDQTDFPVVIDFADSDFAAKAQTDGDDFVFTDASNAKLSHEIESYDYATGHLIAWANVPYVSSTTETILYMYYGNPTASNQENPMAVWDTSYKLVMHLSETHECRMWGMIADSLPHDVVLDHLIYDPSSLKILGGTNRDGWGLVWYDSPNPEIRRGPTQANLDPNFDLAANEMADSGAWIGVGHVRARSSGGIPPWGNPHPFMRYKGGKWWAFSHNGNLNKDILKSLIGPEYLAANPPTYGTNWDDPNCIDSDLYELYVLKCIEANNWNATLGIAQAITDITKLDSGAANFILTDGETLWGFRKGNTLYYYYKATSPQYSAIASQPPDPAQPGWVQLNDYNLITLTKNNPPSIITDIRQQYPLLVDSDFNNSVDSADLRTNSARQDWYESRNDLPTLLYLDTSNVGGDTSKKAGFTADSTKNAYLTQEFSSPQTGTFSASWDIYIDSILDISSPDRAGFMLIGADLDASGGPNRNDAERFVFLGFYKNGGGTTGTMDLVAMSKFDTFTTVASGLNMKQWYTIKVVVNVPAGTYDIYVDGVLKATKNAATKLTSLTHISFAQWNDGAGAFYVDNVFSPAITGYKLTILTEGNGSVIVDPTELSYASGTEVTLTAVPDSGWMFSMWKSNASGSENPIIVTMDGDKTVIANFTKMLLADSEFNDSLDSNDLRNNTAGQDWYESRGDVPTLLFLDETDVGGNTGKKAGFIASASGNAYLSQEFSSLQTGTFSAQWDIYVDSILDISGNPDRTGWMMIGDDLGGTNGPNYPGTERFVIMAFYKDGGGTTGTMDLVARERGAGWTAFTTIVSGLYLKQWYTIRVVCNLDTDTYDIYVDGEYKATVTSYNTKTSVTHISFAQWNDGAGTFYVDNVFAPAVNRYKLTINVVGNGSVTVNPSESTYAAGAEVDLTAIADSGFVFSGWSGDLIDHVNPITITMDSDKIVTATFIEPQYSLTINVVGSGSVAKNPDKSTYNYGEIVELAASPTFGWSFSYWSGDLSGSDNPATITMDGDKVVFARFIQEGTCIDSTANGNDGLLYGGITQGATGEIDGAYEFDGFDDYIEVPHNDALTGFTEAFTASFWLKLDDTTRRQTILNKYNTAGNQRGWFIEYNPVDRPTRPFGFYASQDGLTYREWYASFVPTAGVWYYITVVWEANNVPKFYVNGVQVSTVGTATISSIYNNVGAPLHIGRSTYVAGRYLSGSLDEIRISNPARSADYILTCYNNQKDPYTFYQVGLEESLPTEPMVSDPYPTDGATNIPITLTELSFNLTDYQGDLMDYYVSTYPDIGGDNATGVGDGRYTIAISGLQYQTTYTWHVNVTDGTHWTNRTFTFTTLGELLVDPELNDSVDSDDLRANSPEQDWYESRAGWSGGDPTLLFLDETDVGGNTGKKAGFKASSSGNAYLTQEFRTPQTGTFTVQWNIYVDSILDISSPDRAGIMLIGSDLDAQKGPSSADTERFVFMAFYKDGGATSGPVDLVAMSSFSSFTTIASVNLDQWYTIKVVVNVTAGNYAIYVNGVYKATMNACTKLTSVTHISFAQWNDGAGAFYIDNVYASTVKLFTLTVNIVGKGLVQKNPDQATYTQGTEVKLTAIADPGWAFAGWSGDLTGTENPTTILMNSNKTVTATFTKVANEPPVVSNPQPSDGATGVPVSMSRLNFTISDADGDLMDYYVSTTPDIGGESHTGVSDGTYSLSVSNLAYGTTYQWWINVTDGTHWTNVSYTFTTESPLLVDSEFNDSVNSEDLYTNGPGQDWYDSRAQAPTLVFLDESNIGSNTGKKAGFTASTSGNVYLTQEFSTPQTGVFSVQWDIYVDTIVDISGTDATGWMMIGDDSNPSYPGPNYPTAERFVYMAFYKNGGGTSGTMELFCRQRGTDTPTTIATLNMDQWYTIRVIVNVPAGTYDVYVDGTYMGTYTSRNAKTSVTHISFAQWNDGAGAFYVDNVFAPAVDRYKLTVNIEGNGSVTIDPGESTYAKSATVTLTAVLAEGWSFFGWSGDITSTENTVILTMDSNKTVTATFTYINSPPEASDLSISPKHPTTTDNLVANYTYYDAEGDPENGTEIRWYRNGVLQVDLNDSQTVSSSLTQKGDLWYFTVKPKDGKIFGELAQSPSVTIENTPPTIDTYYPLTDPVISEGETQLFNVTYSDPDNDIASVVWFVNGSQVWEGDEYTFTADYESEGIYNVTVIVQDDSFAYAIKTWILTIHGTNRAPIIDSWDPYPESIAISENENQTFTITYHDPDDDSLTVEWFVNGTSTATGDTFIFEAVFGSAGKYNITVVINDPSLATATRTWTLTVHHVNRPPVIQTYSPEDLTPEVNEGESISFNHTSNDPDGDPISYIWLLDDVEQAYTQNWTYSPLYDAAGYHNVTLIVSDGQLTASIQWNVTVIDVNRPPSAPTIDIMPAEPTTEDNLVCVIITPSVDPDGDTITYIYQWYKNDVLQTELTNNTVPSHLTSKGETWKCVVTSFDGKDYGTSAEAEVTIQNSPPRINNYTPTETSLSINEGESQEFTHTSSDPDNDPLFYEWYLDEALQSTDQNWTYSPDYNSVGNHIVKLIVSDGTTNVTQEWNIEVINVNRPPQITSYSPTDLELEINEGQSIDFTQISTDLDGDTLYYQWLLNGTEQATSQNWTFNTNYETAGFYNVTFAVSDGEFTVTMQWNVAVINVNRQPQIDSYSPVTDPTIFEGDSQEFSITPSDPDNDPLQIQWYLNGTLTTTESAYTFASDYTSAGAYNITVVVSDGLAQATHQWMLTVIDVGPVLDMPFSSDEYPIAVDYSGYGNNGTIYGATWTNSGNGAYYFDGKDDYILVPDSVSLDGGGTWTEITIEFWIRPTFYEKAVRLVEKRSAGSSYQIGFQSTPSAGVLGNQLYWNVWTSVTYKEIVAPFGLPVGEWSHVVCTYKSGVGMVIYVNGVVAVSASHSGTISDSTCPINIGRYGGASSSYFTGLLDDIKIYTKALPQSLIQQNYNSSKDAHNNLAPIIISYSPTNTTPAINEGDTLDFTHVSFDPDYDLLTYSWMLDDIIQATTQNWTYTTDYDDTGFHNVTLVVSDGKLSTTQYWNVTVVNVNQTPEITDYYPDTDPTIPEGQSQEFNIVCSDPDQDALLIQWYLNDFEVGNTNSTSYTFPSSSAGTYHVAVMVSDGLAEAWHNWTLTVISGNVPPSIDGVTISPKPAYNDNTLTGTPYGWNDPNGDSEGYIWRWQKWNGAEWENITGATSNTLDPSNFANGDQIRVMCTPYDGKDYGETKYDTVTIENRPPTISDSTPSVSYPCINQGNQQEFTVTATDPDNDPLTYEWYLNGALNSTSTSYIFDAVAGTSGVHNITVAVKDNHNEIAKRTWLLTVDANLVMPFDTSSTPVADYAGYDNNGTVTGATWTPNGKIGGAYIFDGNDYIKIEDSPNIGGDGTWTEITIEFWIYITQNQRGTRIIAKRGSTTGTYGYQIGFQSGTSKPYNTIYFDIWNAAGTLYEIEYQALSLNTWYYIVCTYNSTEGLKLYIDGNLRASLAGSGNIHSSTGQPLFLGCRYGTSDYFIGLLDEVRIYPKALTAEQINHSYYQTKNLLVGSSPPTTQFASAILMYLTAILASQLVCTVILLSKTKRKWKTNRLSPIIYREEVDWKPLILRKLP